jgi:RimJ/RimL family protein N-acetyltransferase
VKPSLESRRTARLSLGRVRASDLADLSALHADPRVMATLGGVRSEAETAAQIQAFDAHWERHGFGPWVLRDPESGRFLGRGGLRCGPVEGREEVEVLYALAADAWGRGLATELARESVRVAFHELRLPELVCFTLPENARSLAVMQRVGFQYQRDFMHAGRPHRLHRLRAPA